MAQVDLTPQELGVVRDLLSTPSLDPETEALRASAVAKLMAAISEASPLSEDDESEDESGPTT